MHSATCLSGTMRNPNHDPSPNPAPNQVRCAAVALRSRPRPSVPTLSTHGTSSTSGCRWRCCRSSVPSWRSSRGSASPSSPTCVVRAARPAARALASRTLLCSAAWLLGCSAALAPPPSLPRAHASCSLPPPSHPSNPRPHAALDGGSLLRGAAAGVLHRQAETGRAQSGALPRVPHRRGEAS